MSLADNIRDIPPITRFFLIGTVISNSVLAMGLVHPLYFSFSGELLWSTIGFLRHSYTISWGDFFVSLALFLTQSYRFVVCFFVQSEYNLSSLATLYFFYRNASELEKRGKFKDNFPDCLWFFILVCTFIIMFDIAHALAPGSLGSLPLLHFRSLIASVMYMWSRENLNVRVSFFGLFPTHGYYLPLFHLGVDMMSSRVNVLSSLVGFASAYLYQCLQSRTWPIYNLSSRSYSQFLQKAFESEKNKLGTKQSQSAPIFRRAVFDYGYLTAPRWLYVLLKKSEVPSNSRASFVGKGRKLGT